MSSIKFEGFEDILKDIEAMGDAESLVPAMKKACALVERSAKQKAPKGRTGELGRLIQSKVEVNGDEVIGTVFNPLEYAPYVEFGTGLFAEGGNGRKEVPWAYEDEATGELIWTSGQHPQPFLRPALDENREQILRIMEGAQ